MEVWVNSATRDKDYYWCSLADGGPADPPSEIAAGYDLWKFEDCIPWFGLVSHDGVSTLYFGNLLTDREDIRMRPIFVHAVIRATDNDERGELCSLVAELLMNEKELLRKWADYLLGIFDGKVAASMPMTSRRKETSLNISVGRFAYPREDSAARVKIAQALLESSIQGPLVVGTTGRSGNGIFERICNSGNEWQIAIFSGMCTDEAELVPKTGCADFPKPPLAASRTGEMVMVVVGVMMVLALLAVAMKSCHWSKSDAYPQPKKLKMSQGSSQFLPTNGLKNISAPSTNECGEIEHGHSADK